MARCVRLAGTDDLDGSDAGETLKFGLDGRQYEIDLSVENANALRQVLAPFVAHARRVSLQTATPPAAAPTPRRRRGTSKRIVTMQEIEAIKQSRRLGRTSGPATAFEAGRDR